MVGQLDLLQGVSIRRSTSDDADAILTCLATVAREHRYLAMIDPPLPEEVRRYSTSERVIQFVALAGDLVIGWCDLERKPRAGFRHSAGLGMGLLPPCRGRGIATALLRALLDEARAQEVTRIELDVFPSNKPALALYERFAFVYEGTKRCARMLDGEAEDIICMAPLLPPLPGGAA